MTDPKTENLSAKESYSFLDQPSEQSSQPVFAEEDKRSAYRMRG